MKRAFWMVMMLLAAVGLAPAQVIISTPQYTWTVLNTATTGQQGSYVSFRGPLPANSSLQAVVTGTAPVACTFALQGSNDGITWVNLDAGGVSCTASSLEYINNKPVKSIRISLATFTKGDATTVVTFNYAGSTAAGTAFPSAVPAAISSGGTGATTAGAALTSLGAAASATAGGVNIGNLVTPAGCTMSANPPYVCTASAASSVTFSVIPGTFLKLHIDWQGSASTLGSVSLQFNDDATPGDYADQIGRANNITASAIPNVTTQTSMVLVAAFSSSGVGMASIEIPMYTQTINKTAYGVGGIIASASSGTNNFNQSGLGFWNSTAAIIKVKIFNDQGGTITGVFTISASN